MLSYITRRLFIAIGTGLAISVLSFVIIQLPEGDYVDNLILELMSEGTAISLDEAEALRAYYGLDQPVYVQYFKWMGRMLRLDFGISSSLNMPVRDLLADRIPTTIAVAAATILFTWALAIPIGIYSAVRHGSAGDYVATFIGFIGLAIPDFLLGLVLMYFAFAYFGQSVGGLFSPEFLSAQWSLARFWDLLGHLWIPALVLGTAGTAALIRIMRANLLDELRKPYVVTARAKGIPMWKVILKYPVRVAFNPLISTVGYLLPYLVGGSVIVSVVLSLPTLGPLLLRALLDQDMFLAGTIVFMLGILTVIGTLISDILLVVVDPRIRFSRLGT